MATAGRTKAETREMLLRAFDFVKKQALNKKGALSLREVARHAGVSHTLINLDHPEIAALIKVTKDEISKEASSKGSRAKSEVAAQMNYHQLITEVI